MIGNGVKKFSFVDNSDSRSFMVREHRGEGVGEKVSRKRAKFDGNSSLFRCITTSRFFDGSRKSFEYFLFPLYFFFDVIDLDPITFVTNAIAKGCGLPMHRIGACNITKSIYSFGCTKNDATTAFE